MGLTSHPDYREENARVEFIHEYIKNEIDKTEKAHDELRRDTKEAFIEYDAKDSSLSYDEIAVKASLFYAAQQKYRNLLKAEKKPYFARIDFKNDTESEKQKFYIGKMALIGPKNELYIIDWRAPVASVYYESRIGQTVYDSPAGEINGELFLKRQYIIENSSLKDIMDIDITANDEFLQAALGENKDNRLKDIVSTIQAEQNAIIRADIYKPLIVQGVAGSGKTTIALHRIAYLIYTYEKSFVPENFLIIAPNKLFLNYISEVLPELGVERVKQKTFIELVYQLTEIKYKLENPDEKMINLTTGKEHPDRLASVCEISRFKGSMVFCRMIDNYIKQIEESFIPEEDFLLDEYLICFSDEIKEMFINDYSYVPVYERIPAIKMVLKNKLSNRLTDIINSVENEYYAKIKQIKKECAEDYDIHEKIAELIKEKEARIKVIKTRAKTAAGKYTALFPKKSLAHYYEELVTRVDNFEKYYDGEINNDFTDFIFDFCSYNNTLLSQKKAELEDLTPLLYLRYRLFGFSEKPEIKNVVIDEAQDFSLFQIYTLRTVFKTDMFTILGDLAQGIHSYRGITDWNNVLNDVFPKDKCGYLTLEQSYRTTVEIMEAANTLMSGSKIKGLIPAKPVVRHGEKPVLNRCFSEKEFNKTLISEIEKIKITGYKTVAVICKTDAECKAIHKTIPDAVLISSKEESYSGGLVLLPSYLSKGLEFDAVIITAFSEDYIFSDDDSYLTELDYKLLYVAMTRALHYLNILALDNRLKTLDFLLESK